MGVSISKNLYEEHFGLLEFPFGITPNPRFSYSHSPYREAFATLRYGIAARKGFIVITGEVGTGKTTLLRAFMRSVEPTVHTAFIFNPKLTFNQLVRSIFTELGIAGSSQDRFTLIETLNDYLIEQFKKDHIVALLVDEAQDLSDEMLEELRLLSNLETDRSRLLQIVLMGQPELQRRLDQPHLRQLKQRIALRCRLAPLPNGEVGSYINHRLRKAGYQGKELFEAKAVERISLNSQGIPRVINVICDNALLIAYASSKKKVSAQIIEEVARDLDLIVPSGTQRTGSVAEDFQRPRGRNEVTRAEMRGDEPRAEPVSEESFMEGQPGDRYPKRKAKSMALTVFLGVVLIMTSIGAVIYSPPNRELVSDMAVKVGDFSKQSGNYLSGIAVKVQQQGRESFSDAAMKVGDYFDLSRNYISDLAIRMKSDSPRVTNYLSDLASAISAQFQKIRDSVFETALKTRDYLSQMPAKMGGSLQQGRDYVSGLAVKASSSIAAQWKTLKQVQTSQDSRPNISLADSLGREPNDRPAPAGEGPAANTERAKEPGLNQDAATLPETKKIAALQTPKTPAPAADKEETTSAAEDRPKPQSPESEGSQLDRQSTPKREPRSFLGDFKVVQDSFLRDKPQSDAAVTVLPPGTQVKVESKTGHYLRVRSLDDPEFHGYVHLEDAFFEPIR